ncbi:MAG TPA: gephyrin-like molybdotransferase Glp [bacterium]|nr:gephyrin-like molybdotransferase Glp [bacterium]
MRRLETESIMAFDEAERIILAATPQVSMEIVELDFAYGRVLAQSITANNSIPPFDASMVDGFAVRAEDVVLASPSAPVELPIVENIPAGATPARQIEQGTCARIFTGSMLPQGADAVVMMEWASWNESLVRITKGAKAGQHVRRAGEDVRSGDRVLEPGVSLRPQEVGLLASLGFPSVAVARRPRVAILMTGDELLSPGAPLTPGKIRSSNRYTLAGQIRDAGCEVLDLGTARDDPEEIERMLRGGNEADVVITSGGVSVGDHDEVQGVFVRLGIERLFWRVAASPGKPVLFGRWGKAIVFGLPGNPVSSMISFECFVRSLLRRMQGDRSPDRLRIRAKLESEIRGAGARRHFARVHVRPVGDGFAATEVGPKGSGNLRSMVHANGLAIIPEGTDVQRAGSIVEVMLLS